MTYFKQTLIYLILTLIASHPSFGASSFECHFHGLCPASNAANENPDNDSDLLNEDDFAEQLIVSDLIRPIHAELQQSTTLGQYTRPEYHIPLGLDGSDLATITLAAGAMVLAFPNDQSIMDFVQDNKNDVTHALAVGGEFFGSDLAFYGAATGYILGVVLQNGEIKSTSLLLAKTALITGIVAQAAKRILHRERPGRDNGPYEFHGPGLNGDNLSFPSGHTITAFTLATFIAEEFGHHSKIIPVLAYGAAAVGAWSRVHDHAHWASDVIMGALIGHLLTKHLLRKDSSKTGLILSPVYDMEGNLLMGLHFMGKKEQASDLDYLFDFE